VSDAPRTFGRFEIVRELGKGSGGVVFLARDPELGREIALKLLRGGERATDEQVERLRREAEALARVRHPSVVTVYEAGSKDGVRYIALEPVDGRSLERLLAEGRLPLDRSLAILEQAARGVHAAHQAGVLHRDLKPANILVDREGRARVVDFGLARVEDASISLTKTGMTVGTPLYMAPELARGEKEAVGPWTDVWSIGAVLFELLTGGSPFASARTVAAIGERLLAPEPSPRARDLDPTVPIELDAVCARSLEKDPKARFTSALELADALAAARRGLRPPPARTQAWLPLAVLAALVGVLGMIALVVARSSGPTPDGDRAATTSSSVATPASREARRDDGPPWFRALPEAERPRLPLPRDVSFGEQPGEYVNAKDGSRLVFVPAGPFLMGSDDDLDRALPVHEVQLSAYFLGKLELEVAKFARFVGETGHVTTAQKMGSGQVEDSRTGAHDLGRLGVSFRHPDGRDPARDDDPVTQVSWLDARAYVAWAGLALPTEAQWERAAAWDAKTRRQRLYAWGNDKPGAGARLVGNLADESLRGFPRYVTWIFPGYSDGYAGTAPVGSFPDGASPVGALDMTGNVMEWCEDSYDVTYFAVSPREDPVNTDPKTKYKTIRGGSWMSAPDNARARRRNRSEPDDRQNVLGIRVALPAPECGATRR
jgi:serine/threonine-protein kinase